MKMNWEKWNLEPIENSVHTTEYLAFGNALLARLYVKLKLYTNLLSVHNFCAYNGIILFGFFLFFTSSPWWLT